MNKTKGKQLLTFLKGLPEEKFNYEVPLKIFTGKTRSRYLNPDNYLDPESIANMGNDDDSVFQKKLNKVLDFYKGVDPNNCNSVGCVGGWCSVLFKDSFLKEIGKLGFWNSLKKILDLTEGESDFLFFSFCNRSVLSDAFLRLEYLLKGGLVPDYDWSKETNSDLKYNRVGYWTHSIGNR